VVHYVTAKVANVSFEAIVRSALPFLLPLFVVLAMITPCPPLTTWLPGALLGR
jgi:TRAP-type C4-dicarboxylate transport system permease large subunit